MEQRGKPLLDALRRSADGLHVEVYFSESLWKQNLYKTMLWFIYLAKLRTDLLDNRSLAILLETYKLLICYTLVFGQPLSRLARPAIVPQLMIRAIPPQSLYDGIL
jgi:hypothetical protein